MGQIKLNKYFNGKEEEYFNPSFMITILEDMLGESFDFIQNYVETEEIKVTATQIIEFLDQKFTEENPELKKRIEDRKKAALERAKGPIDLVNITQEEIQESTEYFGDQFEADRYAFYPYTLRYFNKYTDIVRKKAKRLLAIIKGLSTNDINPIKDELERLDISLNEDGKISKTDIHRLVIPTIANVNLLEDKLNQANELSTYLEFKLSIHLIYRRGLSEDEMYPVSGLQYQSYNNDYEEDNVKLSSNQRKKINEEREKSAKISAAIICRID